MRVVNLLLILALLLSFIIISGCAKEEEEPRECERNSECKVPDNNKCFTPKCTAEGKCTVLAKENCCGNKICDPKALENQCNCPADCGECSGYVEYNVTSSRGKVTTKYTQYAIQVCENNDCRVGVDMTKVRNISLVDDLVDRDAFKAETLTTFRNPFNVEKDKIRIEFSLKDKEGDIPGNITFTEIKILSDTDEMMGRAFINEKLSRVGSMFSKEIIITSSQRTIEQEKHINLELFYEYQKLVTNYSAEKDEDTGERPKMLALDRSSVKIGLATKPILIAQPSLQLEELIEEEI